MGRFSERRALYYEDDEDFNPVLSVDVNEYLIDNYVATSLKQRRAVWHLCQTDEEFDYSSIEDQIDEWVIKYADTDPEMNIEKKEPADEFDFEDDEDLEEEEEAFDEEVVTDLASVNIRSYLNRTFEDMPDEEADDLIYVIQSHISYTDIYDQISLIVDEFYNGDYDDFLSDTDSDDNEETTSNEDEPSDE